MWIDSQIVKEAEKQLFAKCFFPEKYTVVLGSSNKPETEANIESCTRDNVEILKRAGGGGTVLLYPGCYVVSLGAWVSKPFHNNLYFKLLNASVIETLAQFSKKFYNLSQNGISDIVYGEKKIAGTSMFRSRGYLLYQASILVECDFGAIDRYLKHPTKEPEYRKNRSHKEFLTGLSDIDASFDQNNFAIHFEKQFLTIISKNLIDEFVQPDLEHLKYLKNRF